MGGRHKILQHHYAAIGEIQFKVIAINDRLGGIWIEADMNNFTGRRRHYELYSWCWR